MLAKTNALLLSALRYGDSSLILKTYTAQGIKSFIVSVKGKNAPFKSSMALSLSQLSLVYYAKGKGNLKRIKEATYTVHYSSLGSHPVKNCIVLFLAELLAHVLQEEEENQELFEFISAGVQHLDESEQYANHHLIFCLRLTRFLGFAPQVQNPQHTYFDLLNGISVASEPVHTHYIAGQVWNDWRALQTNGTAIAMEIKLNQTRRAKLLDAILLYYRHHVKDFGVLKSVEVIQAVLG